MRHIAFLYLVLVAASHLVAQETFAVEGYIRSAHLPTSFRAGGRNVVLTRQTRFGFAGSGTTSISDPARQSLHVGAYVQVAGYNGNFITPIAATEVLVRNDANQKLSGIGVITRVITTGTAPVYEADGYQIQITPSTQLDFAGDLGSLSDISVNTWIHYTGERNSQGILEASRAQFIPAKPTKFKAIKGIEVARVEMRSANLSNNAAPASKSAPPNSVDGTLLQEDQQVKIGLGRWHTIPADQPLQQRVHRVGMALVPNYQRQMDDSDPSKIHFRFFAVDDKRLRTVQCLLDGEILISEQMIERLPNDDQLAALLADGIACNLQRQTARLVVDFRIQLAASVAEMFFPPAGFAALGRSVATGDVQEKLAEERLRIALALMQDAGYDPWQAPEAWRLVDPKKLPVDLASLDYTDAGCYQLSILKLQYPRTLHLQQ